MIECENVKFEPSKQGNFLVKLLSMYYQLHITFKHKHCRIKSNIY